MTRLVCAMALLLPLCSGLLTTPLVVQRASAARTTAVVAKVQTAEEAPANDHGQKERRA